MAWEEWQARLSLGLAEMGGLQAALHRSAAEEQPGATIRSPKASALLLEMYDLASAEQAWAAALPPTADVTRANDRTTYREHMLRIQYAVGAFIAGPEKLAQTLDEVLGAYYCDDPTCPSRPPAPERVATYDA